MKTFHFICKGFLESCKVQIYFESSISFLLFERRKKDSLMISVTFLKVCCQPDVSFSRRRCGYSGLVDYISLEALSFE